MHARDGYDYDGYKLRVEFPRGSGPDGRRGGGGGGRFGGFGDRGGGGGRGRGPPSRRSQFRVAVSGELFLYCWVCSVIPFCIRISERLYGGIVLMTVW